MKPQNFKKQLLQIIAGLIVLMVSSSAAFAQCVPGQITIEEITVAPANYDPLAATDTRTALTHRVRNLGSGCTFRSYYCVSTPDTRLEGTSGFLPFGLSVTGSTSSLVNTSQAGGCPPTSTALSNGQQSFIQAGESQTDATSVQMVIANGTFARAGAYSEINVLELAIYDAASGKKLHARSFNPSASAAQACELPEFPTSNAGNKAIYTPAGGGINGGAVSFSGAINSTTAMVDAANMTLIYQGARCNYRSYVAVKSANGGMTQQSGATAVGGSGAFLNRIDYSVEASFCGTSAQFTTAGTAGVFVNSQCGLDGINISDLSITISTANGNTPLLAGRFEDVLTVQIGSQL